jgi:hypothetical protein
MIDPVKADRSVDEDGSCFGPGRKLKDNWFTFSLGRNIERGHEQGVSSRIFFLTTASSGSCRIAP